MNEPKSQDKDQAYTVRLELLDRPGELLRALDPIGKHGGNLLSVVHERGNVTPRGRIPIEIDLKARPSQYEEIVTSFEQTDVKIVHAGAERYSDSLTIILSGHIVDTDLSDTLTRIRNTGIVKVTDFSLSAPRGTGDVSTVRLELAIESGQATTALSIVREIADEKDFLLIEPLAGS